MAGLAERNKNYRQLQQLWKVVENTKVVHYIDNSKRNFFFEAKISTVWLQIKFKIYEQVEGATCQCQTGACEPNHGTNRESFSTTSTKYFIYIITGRCKKYNGR